MIARIVRFIARPLALAILWAIGYQPGKVIEDGSGRKYIIDRAGARRRLGRD